MKTIMVWLARNFRVAVIDRGQRWQWTVDVLLVDWLTGSVLVSINVVTLRRSRLILGWVTVCGRANHPGMTGYI